VRKERTKNRKEGRKEEGKKERERETGKKERKKSTPNPVHSYCYIQCMIV
jgi:hypothetical protein